MIKPVLAALLAASTATLLLTGCGGSAAGAGTDTSSGTTELTIGVLPGADIAPLYLGVQEGFFADEGITLTINSMASSTANIISAVDGGSFDIGYGNTLNLFSAIEHDTPISIISGAATSSGDTGLDYVALVVRPDSGLDSPDDLAKLTVAIDESGSTSEAVLRKLVQAHGSSANSFFTEVVPPIEATAQLESGQVDAALLTEPFATAARLEGYKVMSYPYAEFDPALTVSAYFTSSAFADANPELVDAYLAALEKSFAFAEENPLAVRTNINSYISSGADTRNRLALPEFTTKIDRDAAQKLVDAAIGMSMLTGSIDLEAVLP